MRRSVRLLLLLVLMFALAAPVQAADGAMQRWSLLDGAGGRWAVLLFSQPDPAYPSGWRLRLTALIGPQVLDHQRPLELDDGLGHHWQLENRSAELLPSGGGSLPPQSAQFDLEALIPRPSEALPLHLRVPLEDGVADLLFGPDPISALHTLPASVS